MRLSLCMMLLLSQTIDALHTLGRSIQRVSITVTVMVTMTMTATVGDVK